MKKILKFTPFLLKKLSILFLKCVLWLVTMSTIVFFTRWVESHSWGNLAFIIFFGVLGVVYITFKIMEWYQEYKF